MHSKCGSYPFNYVYNSVPAYKTKEIKDICKAKKATCKVNNYCNYVLKISENHTKLHCEKKKSLVKKLNLNFKKMLKQTSDESILEV